MATVSLSDILGIVAGLLIMGVGAFVLRARPHSPLHRLFFGLAIADGLSTTAFAIAFSGLSETFRLFSFYVYYYSFLAFIGLLFLFGLRFPRPAFSPSPRRIGAWLVMGVVLGGWAIHTIDPSAFWVTSTRGGVFSFESVAGGRVVSAVFSAVTAFVVLRVTFLTLREPSASHRRQGALVLSGMALAYGTVAGARVVTGFSRGIFESWFASSLDRLFVYWASIITLLAIVAASMALALEHRADRRFERNIILGCLGGVLLLTLVAGAYPAANTVALLKQIALLAYPVLLMYALLRYEVLDIDARLRKTAAISLLGAAFTGVFFVLEEILQNIIQDLFASQTTSGIAAILLAALVTAAVSAPVGKFVRRVVDRIAPQLKEDKLDVRKIEIYRHAVEGAAADGIIATHELVVLRRLRESLEISMSDHDSIMSEIAARGSFSRPSSH